MCICINDRYIPVHTPKFGNASSIVYWCNNILILKCWFRKCLEFYDCSRSLNIFNSDLLEVCDRTTQEQVVAAEKHLANVDDESDFEEDLAVITGKNKKVNTKDDNVEDDQDSDMSDSEEDDNEDKGN